MVAFQSILKVRMKRSQGDYSAPDEELIHALKKDIERPPVERQAPAKNKTLTLAEVQNIWPGVWPNRSAVSHSFHHSMT